jgi:hypothetical protein
MATKVKLIETGAVTGNIIPDGNRYTWNETTKAWDEII